MYIIYFLSQVASYVMKEKEEPEPETEILKVGCKIIYALPAPAPTTPTFVFVVRRRSQNRQQMSTSGSAYCGTITSSVRNLRQPSSAKGNVSASRLTTLTAWEMLTHTI